MNPKPLNPSTLPFRWNPSEHMTVIGTTGSGKSVLQASLLTLRKFWVVLKSKSDRTEYGEDVTTKTAKALENHNYNKIVLAPAGAAAQQREFAKAFETMWQQRGWTIIVDELWWIDKKLKLGDYVDTYMTQGRDPGKFSMVCGMQRPTQVTRFAVGESTHVLSFGLEGRDAKILEQAASPRLGKILPTLSRHEFVWYNVPTRRIWVGKLDLRTGSLIGDYVR